MQCGLSLCDISTVNAQKAGRLGPIPWSVLHLLPCRAANLSGGPATAPRSLGRQAGRV